MKIAFLYPRWSGEYGLFGYFAKRNSTWMPQNIALLAAIAEQHGHTASIIDGQAEDVSEGEMVNRALALKPDVFALTCYSPFFHLNTSGEENQRLRQHDSHPGRRTAHHHRQGKNPGAISPPDYLFMGKPKSLCRTFSRGTKGRRPSGSSWYQLQAEHRCHNRKITIYSDEGENHRHHL